MFFGLHIDSFINYLRFERRYSEHTITAYSGDLSDFSQYLKQFYELDDLIEANHRMIRSWVVGLVNEGMQERTVNRKVSSLRAFYRFMVRKGALEKNPMSRVNGMKTPARLPAFVDQKDMNRLMDEVVFPDGFEGLRDKVLLETFYATGMRLSELIGLSDSSIDTYNQQLKVLGKGNKERIIPLHPQHLARLKAYRDERMKLFPGGPLFVTDRGVRLYEKFVYRKVKQYLAYVSTLKKKSPHILRHSFATHMMNNGAELNAVKELLGHKSLAATQVYTHNTIQKLKDIHKQAHPKS